MGVKLQLGQILILLVLSRLSELSNHHGGDSGCICHRTTSTENQLSKLFFGRSALPGDKHGPHVFEKLRFESSARVDSLFPHVANSWTEVDHLKGFLRSPPPLLQGRVSPLLRQQPTALHQPL